MPCNVPLPRTVSPSSPSSASPPISVTISRSASPACVVRRGQPGTVTLPPVTSPTARNGAAFERSGSTSTSTARTSDGGTHQRFGAESSTSTPCSRSCSTVMSMCGSDGTGLPSCRTSTPSSYLAPASSSAEMNWLEAEASMITRPPRTRPRPSTLNGSTPRPSSSTTTPSPRRPRSTSCMGRDRACGSPSKSTGPSASAATGGTKRITVPARPQWTLTPPWSRAGVTFQSSPSLSTPAPIWPSAAAINSVSRERSAWRTTLGPFESAASTRARFVRDLEPGSRTAARTGPSAWGAGQGSAASFIGPERIRPADGSGLHALHRKLRLDGGALAQMLGLALRRRHCVAGPPGDAGLALGIDRCDHQAAEHREILEEMRHVLRPGVLVLLLPERVAGHRGRYDGGGQGERREPRSPTGGEAESGDDVHTCVDPDHRRVVLGNRQRWRHLPRESTDPVVDRLGGLAQGGSIAKRLDASVHKRGGEHRTRDEPDECHGAVLPDSRRATRPSTLPETRSRRQGASRCRSRGNSRTCRMFAASTSLATQRSRPIAKPPCGGIPCRKAWRYHSYDASSCPLAARAAR